MINNDYIGIAPAERAWLDKLPVDEEGFANNAIVVSCEQVTEKYMKGILEQQGAIPPAELAKLLRTHNLRTLGIKLNSLLGVQLPLTELAFLGDFYFDARYPGDNFLTVTPEISNQCREIMEGILVILQPFAQTDDTTSMNLFK